MVSEFSKALSFDDVILEPNYSTIQSRHDIDISTKIADNILLGHPIISSPMDTVTEAEMAEAMAKTGSFGIIHRYNSIDEQVNEVVKAVSHGYATGCAVGVTGDYLERAAAAVGAGASIICIDVAHGHHQNVLDAIWNIKTQVHGEFHLMVGNVATATGYGFLADAGADSVRVGIGSGSICTTRQVTGHGVPLLTSLMRAKRSKDSRKRYGNAPAIIADGGMRSSGDIVKALAAGADAVITGRLLAGADESPEGFTYRGMASSEAQNRWRGYVSVEEGVAHKVHYSGPVKEVIDDLCAGIRSGLSYSGARNLEELRQKAKFTEQTSNGLREGGAHIFS